MRITLWSLVEMFGKRKKTLLIEFLWLRGKVYSVIQRNEKGKLKTESLILTLSSGSPWNQLELLIFFHKSAGKSIGTRPPRAMYYLCISLYGYSKDEVYTHYKLKFSVELTVIEKANHDVIRAVQSSMSNRRHSLMITWQKLGVVL